MELVVPVQIQDGGEDAGVPVEEVLSSPPVEVRRLRREGPKQGVGVSEPKNSCFFFFQEQ